jgi:hypothetical protein
MYPYCLSAQNKYVQISKKNVLLRALCLQASNLFMEDAHK